MLAEELSFLFADGYEFEITGFSAWISNLPRLRRGASLKGRLALHLHIRAMKCVALLAEGRLAEIDLVRPASRTAAASGVRHDRPGGRSERDPLSYSTSARQIVSDQARANVVRGLIAAA